MLRRVTHNHHRSPHSAKKTNRSDDDGCADIVTLIAIDNNRSFLKLYLTLVLPLGVVPVRKRLKRPFIH